MQIERDHMNVHVLALGASKTGRHDLSVIGAASVIVLILQCVGLRQWSDRLTQTLPESVTSANKSQLVIGTSLIVQM